MSHQAQGRWCPCYRCNEGIWLTPQVEETLRRSRAGFFCLWGHEQSFPEKESEADILRRERDRLKQAAAQKDDELKAAWATANDQSRQREGAERRAAAARGQVTRLKNRAAAGLCPCCNRSFQNLSAHMKTKHAGFLAEEVQSEHGTIQ